MGAVRLSKPYGVKTERGLCGEAGEFMSDSGDRENRAEYYRQMAQDAEAAAAKLASPKSREAYLTLARKWRELAEMVDKRR